MDGAFKGVRAAASGDETADLRNWITANSSKLFDPKDPYALPHPSVLKGLPRGAIVGLFGTSANPPHVGHSSLLRYFASRKNVGLSELWVLPVYSHMFSQKNAGLVSFEHRLKMCELAFSDVGSSSCRIRILAVEKIAQRAATDISGKPRIGTAAILRFLRFIYGPDFLPRDEDHYEDFDPNPNLDFSLLVGMDTWSDLQRGKWADSEYILSTTHVHATARNGAEAGEGAEGKEGKEGEEGVGAGRAAQKGVTIHKHEAGSFSSTEVRLALAEQAQQSAQVTDLYSDSSSSSSRSASFHAPPTHGPEAGEKGKGKGKGKKGRVTGAADAVVQYIQANSLYTSPSPPPPVPPVPPLPLPLPPPDEHSAVPSPAPTPAPAPAPSPSKGNSSSPSLGPIALCASGALLGLGLAWLWRTPRPAAARGENSGGILFLTLPTITRAAKLGAKYVTTEGAKAWAPEEWAKKIVNLSLQK